MLSNNVSLKRKAQAPKTPVTVLYELCTQEKEFLKFENILHDSRNMFSCSVSAFGIAAIGSGRSKKEAKHEASAKLVAQLMGMDRFKQIPHEMPEVPRPIDGDAISELRSICVQRKWPMATFVNEFDSQMHTCVCRISDITRTGTSSTKKVAKQIAAREMLNAVESIEESNKLNRIATIDVEPPEKIFRAYVALKRRSVRPRGPEKIRNRHCFYLQLPEEDRNEARNILMDDSSAIYGTSKDRVHLACTALKLKYNVSIIENHPKQFSVFYLIGDHDCVIAGKEDDLYNRVIDYLKTMLNLQ